MIKSLWTSRDHSKRDRFANVSIELSPEYGWPLGNQRVFGPGTLFQGHVIVKCNRKPEIASRLRILFKGVETMLAYDVGPGMFRTHAYDLFSTASTLWKVEEHSPMTLDTSHRFQFTVQMPMVQYPPSFQHHMYRCYYLLMAYLEPLADSGEFPAVAQQPIQYIPLIETRPFKTPLYMEVAHKAAAAAALHIKLDAREYVSGDTIHIRATHDDGNEQSVLVVNVRLYRILTLLDHPSYYPTEELVKSTITVLQDGDDEVRFCTNPEWTPTVDYSPIMRLSYRLHIKVSAARKPPTMTHKHRHRLLLLLPAWRRHTTTASFETPIVIGTLGSGVRVVDELSTYSFLRSHASPKFVKDTHHEDLLPKYEPCRLPCYNSSSIIEQNQV